MVWIYSPNKYKSLSPPDTWLNKPHTLFGKPTNILTCKHLKLSTFEPTYIWTNLNLNLQTFKHINI